MELKQSKDSLLNNIDKKNQGKGEKLVLSTSICILRSLLTLSMATQASIREKLCKKPFPIPIKRSIRILIYKALNKADIS